MMKGIIKILKIAVVFFLITACQSGLYTFEEGFGIPQRSKEQPLVHFIMDQDPVKEDDLSHFIKTLDYAKIPLIHSSVPEMNRSPRIGKATRVICLGETWDLSQAVIDSITVFVARGGTLLVAERNWDERMAFLLGLTPDFDLRIDDKASGMFFKSDILPGFKGKNAPHFGTTHKGLASNNFKNDVRVLATAANDKTFPLITENLLGHGRVLLYNSVNKFGKPGRGIFFSMLLNGLEGVPYPIVNTAAIFLDDFPAPLYEIDKEPVKSEMGKNVAEFVTDTWWPDMKKIANEHGIKYTAYVTFDYNRRVNPPFMFTEWDRNMFQRNGTTQSKSTWLGHDILASGHELGFHGYNHVSLLAGDWKREENILAGLEAAKKKWITLDFGSLPVSYVPPSNYIDSLGVISLSKAMPSLKYIQSTYLGDFEEGGDREFGPEPWSGHFFSFPRISSGFIFSQEDSFQIASMFLYTGVWTHFVHPDDVYQIPDMKNIQTAGDFDLRNPNRLNWRNGSGKKGMLDVFIENLEAIKKRQPLMRFMTATEAARQTAHWRYAYFEHLMFEDLYTVASDYYNDDPSHEQFWSLFARNNNQPELERFLVDQGASFKKTPFSDGHLYTIKTQKAFLSVQDIHKISGYKGVKDALAPMVWSWRDKFNQSREKILPIKLRIGKYVQTGNIVEAIKLLENHIRNGEGVTDEHWKEYLKYLQWQDRGPEVYHLLEETYRIQPSAEVVALAKQIDTIEAYPTTEFHKKWLKRQIDWKLAGEKELLEYLELFKAADEKFYVAQVHKELLKNFYTPKRQLSLVKHLLDYEMEELFDVLQDISPCSDLYKELSYGIAWAYAHRKDYDRALDWAECTSAIDQDSRNFWIMQSGALLALKESDIAVYFDLLLTNEPLKAAEELRTFKGCLPELEPLASKIATTLANYGHYQNAVSWAPCAMKIPITDLLLWHYEVGDMPQTRAIYSDHIKKYPDDVAVKQVMSEILLYKGEVSAAAAIGESLIPGKEYQAVKHSVNKSVRSLDLNNKREILKLHPSILYAKTKSDILAEVRAERGNSLVFRADAMNDKLDPTVLTFKAGYDLIDRKFNIHSVNAIRNYAYPINFIADNKQNTGSVLMGLEYEFMSRYRNERSYKLLGRLENDERGKTFFHLGASLDMNNKENFHGYSLKYAPVQTGPGYNTGIYRLHAQTHHQFKITTRLMQSVSLEGSYYTDEVQGAEIVSRSRFSIIKQKNWTLGPLAEFSYSLASSDRRDGFPYWIADNRLFAGGGMQLDIGKMGDGLFVEASASHFYENQGEPSFERYTGTVHMRIKKYTILNLSAEVYTIPRFFSNSFGFGLIHNLK
ncbi:DUF2194 domain-containing protein [Zeaxanthinibacter enoshimensis]|uniref:DUF2194 domain-containing protein n=1 Tax=Zeaxanthinibacter enoshimensis TaxID=392009 RepID=A0A4R6TQ59_9FLAO|nr:DUF2194 domain-containing protein [Zeaxanthinibacter enoshimensis]TDQ32576.1 hypothetical protein CLV82_0409 [Zeaxanthinibacter enoshimensis]